MKIWLINHYAVPPQYYPLARPSLFAKNLTKMGHEVTIIAASTVHNSDKNLIDDKAPWRTENIDGVKYVYIRCIGYQGNGLKRILNMLEFAMKLPRVCRQLQRPDAIVSTSLTPMACAQGISLAHKYGCKGVAEIADLWPETLIAYGVASKNNPAVLILRKLEKWIYTHADEIIFTMEGAYDYIIEQGWQKEIPKEKVHYINNGVDLEEFIYNREHFQISDPDLENPDIFKVVYAGAIRKVNNLGRLLDAAKEVKNTKVRLLIWGDGDEFAGLQKRVHDEEIKNVIFKGRVDKKNIPFITSMADLNVMHGDSSSVLKYGLSANKLFDYFAAGKPILCNFDCKYNPMLDYDAGITVSDISAKGTATMIKFFVDLSPQRYKEFCKNAENAAKIYDFRELTNKLLRVIGEN